MHTSIWDGFLELTSKIKGKDTRKQVRHGWKITLGSALGVLVLYRRTVVVTI